MIPGKAVTLSQSYTDYTDVVLVIGTSAMVYPAAGIPVEAKQHGAKIIEFNIEKTALTSSIGDILIEGEAGRTLPKLLQMLK